VEDGSLGGAQLAWSSDRDGALGTGTLAHATNLSLGTHIITLAVRDTYGHRVTQQARIVIGAGERSLYLPLVLRTR